MRIILTCNHSPWSPFSGGAQRSTHMLAKALARRGHEVSAVYTRPPTKAITVPENIGYEVHWAPFFAFRSHGHARLQPLNALTVSYTVARLLGTRAAHAIVHAQGEEAALLPPLRSRLDFSLIATVHHGYYPPDFLDRFQQSRLNRLWLEIRHAKYALQGHVLRRADACSAPSAHAVRLTGKAYGIPPEELHVIPSGVHEAFLTSERAGDHARGPLLYFGRYTPVRGVDTLLDALARLENDAPRAVLIGRTAEDAGIEDELERRGLSDRVQLLPWMTPAELRTHLAAASMVVIPSRYESFGNAVAETMAAGAPLISTTAGAIPELVDHERTGLLVPPGDPAALAGAIRRLCANPSQAERLGEAARRAVENRFRWDKTAKRYEQLYRMASAGEA